MQKLVHVLLHTIFSLFRDVGMYQESQHILKEALGILMNCCGEESVEVAKVLHSLGETYFRMEEFKESRFAILNRSAYCNNQSLNYMYCCIHTVKTLGLL